MDPTAILATIRAGFDFGTELLRYLQTPEGKAFTEQAIKDRAAWDKFWADAASGIKRLVSGELFK